MNVSGSVSRGSILTKNSPQQQDAVQLTSSAARLAYLDSVRAVAALWVVCSHVFIFRFGIVTHSGLFGWATNWLIYSHLAVDVFIVLSGFCLMLPVANNGKISGGTSVAFFRRRAWRILPAMYTALFFSIAVFCASHTIHQILLFDWRAVVSNVFMVQDVFQKHNVFDSVLWSVSVEWRIYFLFPLMIFGVQRWGWGRVIAGIGMLTVPIVWLVETKLPAYSLACPWYLLLFAIGAGSASYSADKSRIHTSLWIYATLICTVLLAWCLACFPIKGSNLSNFTVHMPLIDIIAGMAAASAFGVLRALQSGSPLSTGMRILNSSILRGIGKSSYSLYLIHIPVLLMCGFLGTKVTGLTAGNEVWVVQICLAIFAIPAATYVLYRYVELPTSRMR